jgi:hypothetical protein
MKARFHLTAMLVATTASAVMQAAHPVLAQQETPIVQQDIEVVVDRLGNADVSARFTLPAAQWRMWDQVYGQNQSLMKRDFEHQYSAVVLHDFKLERDEMNRTATLRMKGEANAEYRGQGQWEVELEKGLRSTRVSDTQWHFTKTSSEGGVVLQQNFILKLPKGTKGAQEGMNELGVPVLKYELAAGRRSPVLPVLGAVLGLLGLVAILLGVLRKAPA